MLRPTILSSPAATATTAFALASGLALATTAALAAQGQTTKTAQLPTVIGVPKTNNLPFGEPVIRYQQLYPGSQFATQVPRPVRFVGIEFLGAVPGGVILDMEITLANAPSSLSGMFASNYIGNRVVVFPRSKLTPNGSNGTLPIPFATEWVYDGKSNVVIDVKIFGNGTGKRFNHAAQSTISTISGLKRQYFIGNANATTANSSGATGHYGLVTRFFYQEGGAYPYGVGGCPGGGNFVPKATTNRVPLPGDAGFAQLLTNAGPGYPAIFFVGGSSTLYNGIPLPVPLTFLGGPNCQMEAAPLLYVFTTTGGAGLGGGAATLPTPIPAIGSLTGIILYSQWAVLDKASPNGSISVSNALMQVIGG